MDWQTASDQLEKMYNAVQETLICPIYLFDFWTIPYFVSYGVSLDQIKRFLHLCKPLLQMNFSTPAAFDETKTYDAIYELGKEIAGNINEFTARPL